MLLIHSYKVGSITASLTFLASLPFLVIIDLFVCTVHVCSGTKRHSWCVLGCFSLWSQYIIRCAYMYTKTKAIPQELVTKEIMGMNLTRGYLLSLFCLHAQCLFRYQEICGLLKLPLSSFMACLGDSFNPLVN